MPAPTTPAEGVPPAKVYPRKTRTPDWMTDVVLATTAFFSIWAIVLFVLAFLGIARPQVWPLDQKAAIKAVGSTVIVILTIGQVYTMESVLGHLPRGRWKISQMMRFHRINGRITIALAVVIAFFCIVDVGAPSSPLRVLLHVVFGSLALATLAIKFALIRFKPKVAYDAAPWLGRVAAFSFVVIFVTSGFAYFTGNL